jgi:hypothetical protein
VDDERILFDIVCSFNSSTIEWYYKQDKFSFYEIVDINFTMMMMMLIFIVGNDCNDSGIPNFLCVKMMKSIILINDWR